MAATIELQREAVKAADLRTALREYADDPQLILDMIEGETNFDEAILAVDAEVIEDEILVTGLKAKLDELTERKERVERAIETKRNLILMAMARAGKRLVKGPAATISVRDTPAKIVVTNEAEIPARFWTPRDPTLDKAALRDALAAEETIPGALLSNGGVALTVRRK